MPYLENANQGGLKIQVQQGNSLVDALTLDFSKNATFAGNVTADKLVIDGASNSNVSQLALTRTDFSWGILNETNLRFYVQSGNTTTPNTQVLEIATSGNATFAGSIDTTAVNIKVGSAIHGTITSSSNSLTLNARNTGHMIFQSGGSEKMRIAYGGNVGIGVTGPQSKLQVAGGIQMADDTDTASAAKVGTLKYRVSGNNSYVDMCMQTGATTYAWINIVQNNW